MKHTNFNTMHKKNFLALCLLFFSYTVFAQSVSQYVDPFIGTSNFGATHPGAIVPWGMASVSPYNVSYHGDANPFNNKKGWNSRVYTAENTLSIGFSHVNLSGVGCPDLGSILLMPTCGDLDVNYLNYVSPLTDEQAQPGYYRATMGKYGIGVEATATTRTGISRYSYPQGQGHVILNLGEGLTNESGASVRVVSDREVEGSKLLGTFCYHSEAVFTVYFVVRFSHAATAKGCWKKQPKLDDLEHEWSATSDKIKYYKEFKHVISGNDVGAYFTFDLGEGEKLEAQVGVSYVSIENARRNLEEEAASFDDAHQAAAGIWEEALSKIVVEGGSQDDKVKFYTALYHTLFHPNIIQDVNGDYPRMQSGEVGNAGKDNRYTVFSLWDTYRNLHPLMCMLFPERQEEMVRSMLAMQEESGWLPKWELYSQETHTMDGDPALIVIADTYLRGLRNFDIDQAYKAMTKQANTIQDNFIRHQNKDYWQLGYVPLIRDHDNSVSEALELYMADWSLGQLAKALGKQADYKKYNTQAQGYKHYYDAKYKLLRPKLKEGRFMPDFDPLMGENFEPAHGFHEGTSWNYSFAVPYDVKGLKKLMGGSKAFTQHLWKCFADSLYDCTNEPNISYPFLFNYIPGEEWRTQTLVNALVKEKYTTGVGGIPGNDDTGTLSAWLVYAMMGFYPTCPADMNYALTTPAFEKITIHLDEKYYPSSQLQITTDRAPEEAPYLKGIRLKDKPLKSFFVNHFELFEAGQIHFNNQQEK